MAFSRLLTGAAALSAILVAAPGLTEQKESIAQPTTSSAGTSPRSDQEICRYGSRNGRLTITRTKRDTDVEKPSSIGCPDFDRTDASAYLQTVNEHDATHQKLRNKLNQYLEGEAKKISRKDFEAILDPLYDVGQIFACAYIRAGLKSQTEADAPLADLEQLARSRGENRLAQWMRGQRGIVDQFGRTSIASTDAPPECLPKGYATPIPDATWRAMQGKSWHPGLGCPRREELALLRMPYVDFQRGLRRGEMIVAKSVAANVLDVFEELYRNQFPIAVMELIDKFDGDDKKSMAANNTSGFNCRPVSGGRRLSEHAFGTAIDINPVQNPYVTPSETVPSEGNEYNSPGKRATPRAGMIQESDLVTKAFRRIGWKWGGAWGSTKDYQHFSQSGR